MACFKEATAISYVVCLLCSKRLQLSTIPLQYFKNSLIFIQSHYSNTKVKIKRLPSGIYHGFNFNISINLNHLKDHILCTETTHYLYVIPNMEFVWINQFFHNSPLSLRTTISSSFNL